MDIETIRTVGIGLLVCVAVAGILGIALLRHHGCQSAPYEYSGRCQLL